MLPQEIFTTINNIFTKNGTEINDIKIKSLSPLDIQIDIKNNYINILFPNNKPKAAIKRFITISANVERISLGQTGGYIKLKYFPEFAFSYEKVFSDSEPKNISDIHSDINKKYGKQSREIANLCLQYANSWAIIASRSDCFSGATAIEKSALKKQCMKYVVENVKLDIEKKYGSVILTYLLVFIIIPSIARFIITRLLEKYF